MKRGISSRYNSCNPLIFIILILFLLSFAHQVPLAFAALEDKEVIAGVPANFPPQYYSDTKTGKPYGFAIDVMDEIARRSGVKIKYIVFANFSDVIVALQKGEIDLVPNLGITQERLNYTDFTAPVETFHIHIFVRSTTDDIKNIDDLAGRKVAVVAENQGYFIMMEKKGVELVVYRSMEEAFMALISGNADAMVYPETQLILFARQSGLENRIKTTGDALAEIKRSIGVRKGQPDLYNKLDETVKAFILTPEYEKILSKWYGEPEAYWNTQRVLAAMGIAAALVAAVLFIYHYFSVLHLNRNLKNLIEMQKKAEVEIIESKKFIESIVNLSSDILYIYDIKEQKNIYSNNGIQTVLGYSAKEVQEMGIQVLSMLMHPDDFKTYLEETYPKYSKLKDNETIIHQYRMKHKNGEWHWLDCNEIIYLSDLDGSARQIFGVVHDITRLKQIEAELNEKAARLHTELEVRKQAEEELKKHREHLEELVKERTAELNIKNEELERFNKLFVGRELKMIELKKQIAELNKKIGSTENTKGT